MKPTRRQMGGLGVAGAIAAMLTWFITLGGVEVPAPITTAMGTIIGFAVRQFTDRGPAPAAASQRQSGRADVRLLLLTVAAGLLVALSACATTTPEARLAATCDAYAGTLNSLAAVRSGLSPGQVETVNEMRAVANPLCESPPANAGKALITVSEALTRLSRVREAQP